MGGVSVMSVEPSWMGLVPFVKEDTEISPAPSPGEDTSEQAPAMKQEVILLVYYLSSQPLEL